jgi:single-strand DNA-binding protein
LSYTPKGTALCKFSMACNRFYRQDQEQEMQKEVSFFEITCWLRLAEVCGEFLKKGRDVRVVGRLKQDRWTDADGRPRSRVFIVAEHMEFRPLVKAKDGEEGQEKEGETADAQESEADTEQDAVEMKEAASF